MTILAEKYGEKELQDAEKALGFQGKKMALITDAGTPGISDPAFLLVRECIKNNIRVECLPGATAFGRVSCSL